MFCHVSKHKTLLFIEILQLTEIEHSEKKQNYGKFQRNMLAFFFISFLKETSLAKGSHRKSFLVFRSQDLVFFIHYIHDSPSTMVLSWKHAYCRSPTHLIVVFFFLIYLNHVKSVCTCGNSYLPLYLCGGRLDPACAMRRLWSPVFC